MATGLEVVGVAATLVSIIGFSAQVFDGCVKGFVLLSAANNLGRDADILRSMLEWEQFRLEQWAEKAGLQDPAKADILLDWKLITDTLQHIKNLVSDTEVLKKKYNLTLVERPPKYEDSPTAADEEDDRESIGRFKRLFGQSGRSTSNAAAKVIQSKTCGHKKLWWAAVDKNSFQRLVNDIAHFVQRLHDSLNVSIQCQMQKQIESLLQDGTQQYSHLADLEVLRELAARSKQEPPSYEDSHAEEIAAAIEKKFANELFWAVQKGDIKQVEVLLNRGVDVQVTDNSGWPPLIRAGTSSNKHDLPLCTKSQFYHNRICFRYGGLSLPMYSNVCYVRPIFWLEAHRD